MEGRQRNCYGPARTVEPCLQATRPGGHDLTKIVSIEEMLVFFGNDELCSRRAAPATVTT